MSKVTGWIVFAIIVLLAIFLWQKVRAGGM